MTVKQERENLIYQLQTVSDSPAFEANELLIAAASLKRSSLIYEQDKPLTSGQLRDIKKMLRKRKKGIPLQYIIGEWEFFSLPFKVGRGVLIPRADSELLVELALEDIDTNEEKQVLDLCSGSGAIGIAVSKNRPLTKVTLVEKSRKAIGYLRKNIALNGVTAREERADVFKWRPQKKADLLLCNPPYITGREMLSLQREVRHEPAQALYGGFDGLKFYRFLAESSGEFLKKGGRLIVEIGYLQADSVVTLFTKAGLKEVEVYKDLSGNDRAVSAVYI